MVVLDRGIRLDATFGIQIEEKGEKLTGSDLL
jgi:hypothetical protein